MALHIASLNSGSNGNCYYIGNHHDAVLVDAGISCRETVKRMTRAGLDIKKVRAIFISHEHSDHIRGVEVLSRKYKIPVYITPATHDSSRLFIDPSLLHRLGEKEPVNVQGISVVGFRKSHDAADPFSFIVSYNNIVIGVFTDIGHACHEVTSHFSRCHAAFLEANYDEDMLRDGNYPWHLKNRISGEEGHLSNRQALELFLQHRSPSLSHVLLSHLSRENNSPQLVAKLFKEHAGEVHVEVASRDYESPVFHITGVAEEASRSLPESATQLQLDIS